MNNAKAHAKLLAEVRLALGGLPGTDFEPLHQTRPSIDDRGNHIPAGGMCAGAADLIGTVFGRRVDLEIKTGNARQSKEQRQWQRRIESAGGVCFVVRSVDDAIHVYTEVREQVRATQPLLFRRVLDAHSCRKNQGSKP